MTSQAESSCATCPLMVSVLPLRYAIGPADYTGDLLSGLDFPALPEAFPATGPRYHQLEGKPLHYMPRLLRDGWLYVWVEMEQRLVEYKVSNGQLSETSRGGPVIDTRTLAYFFVPAGDPIAIAWSPVQWPDTHYKKLASSADDRAQHLRELTPGSGSQSAVLTESLYNSVPELTDSSAFDWSNQLPITPLWPNLNRQMSRHDQQATVIVDDSWGVIHDLASLIRLAQEAQETARAHNGEKWGLAGVIRELSKNDAQLRQKLPELTDFTALQQAWRESDDTQRHYETTLTKLVDAWASWLATLNCEGVGTLHSACEGFDLANQSSRDILEDHFSIGLTGPTYLSPGAAAVGRAMALKGEHTPWLWYVMLGLKDKLTLGEVEKLVNLSDQLVNAGEGMGTAIAAFVSAINNNLTRLNLHMPTAPTDAFFTAISPVAGAELHNLPDNVGYLGSGFMMAALSRTGQELVGESVDKFTSNQWLSEAAGTAKPTKLPDLAEGKAGEKVTVLRTKAANYSHFGAATNPSHAMRANPYTWDDAVFKKAKLRSFLVVLTGLNLVLARSEWSANESPKTGVFGLGALFGFGTAFTSVHHKLSELNWKEGLSTQTNPEAHSHTWGMRASFLAASTAAFDVIIFGMSAFESYKAGDFDTAGLEVGLAGVSAGQLNLAVTAFRAYREARAAVLAGETATAVRALSRLGGWFTALSIGLVATLIGGLVARYYIENTPLEDWVANTRFGTMPAGWAGNFMKEMQHLYKSVFPIKLRLETAPHLNPRTGDHANICMLLLELPGQTKLGDTMIHFKGHEQLSSAAYRALAWSEEQIRSLFSDEEQERLLNPEKKAVEWTGEDFDRHQGTHVNTPVGTVVYRRIYHGKDQIKGLEGTLIYEPQPGLTMPPLEVSL